MACSDDGKPELEQSDSAVGASDSGVPTAERRDAGDPRPLDAAQPALDASEPIDSTVDGATAPDAEAPHPLQGRYAVRTVSYARQKTLAAGIEIDVVSKGVLLSVADISARGVVQEQLCFIELINPDGQFSWIAPAGSQRIPGSTVTLAARDGRFVRERAADETNVSWSPTKQPADCVAGATHSTGCLCFAAEDLPSDPKDCRVTDLDEDGAPGLELSVGFERPVDPATAQALLSVQIVGIKAVEWRLPTLAGEKLLGKVAGSVEQNQLSLRGELAEQIGKVRSATCSDELAHVELVRGDFDCSKLLAGRSQDLDSYGIFDPSLDAPRPSADACPDPDCARDSDNDGNPDCRDACPLDVAKLEAGACGCSTPDTNADGDAQPDCTDECDADPLKALPGLCGCGVAETNADADALPDCSDECDADPEKTLAGVCGCGVADTDSDADGTPDCNESCDNDAAKTAPGVCGCGVPDADLNNDGTLDCVDLCPDDPAKLAPGACGCGVSDANSDGDAQLDCVDECDSDPNKVLAGSCGCGVAETVCNNPLLGTYALRTVVHARQRIGSDAPTTSRAISYGLVTVTSGADGALAISELTCWGQSLPNPAEAGTKVYGWSKPAWAQALPPAQRSVVANANGTYTASSPVSSLGWDPARQPAACTASATPSAGWPSAWGATCTCSASALPPYDRDGAPYDCRLIDADGDGYPGVSAFVSTAPPSSPDADATGLLSARAFAASRGQSRWTLTPSADRKHTGTVVDESVSNLVGCTGTACLGLSAVAPNALACPEALNTLQWVPVTPSSDSCAEIVAQRDSLFSTSLDKSWAEAAACPNP